MRKFYAVTLSMALAASMLAGCGQSSSETAAAGEASAEADGLKKIDTLSVSFVPSREPEEIVTATEPLKGLLKDEMKKQGYDIGEVDITVGTNYEAVGEALTAGTTDVGLIPGGTYVLYEDGADVILTATRDGLSIESDDPKVWNENKPTTASDQQVTFYRALIIAGPSAKGRELADKVNAGEALTWEDLDSANWSVMGSSSSAGYIYPTIWLQDNYGKSITDLSHAVQADSYGSSFARLASGQVDVLCVYADGRRDYEDKWQTEFGREKGVWDETDVIGVTAPIYNDTISVRGDMDDAEKEALANAFIEIAKTDEGKKVISIYSHQGYEKASKEDYENEKKAQEIIKQMQAAN
ncbi:MAG: PhnD/SsuA/transferrin family substrate-binding protein [Eubacteriales bacterium]|nr:PhnD/SsuA/transferrin family substrate-binding protein [Eubacteriales bacterium]